MPRTTRPPAPAIDTSERPSAPGGVASVDRALSLLTAFSLSNPTLTLSELAEHTDQYKSTVLRMLASLENACLVRRHVDGRFALGPMVARLSAVYARSFSIGEVVLPALQQLVDQTRESAAFHVQQGDQDLCLYRIDSPHTVRDHTRAGDMQPLARSIAGKVLQAYNDGAGRRGARIRQQHLLVADGDLVPELAAIVAPVFAADRSVSGVLVLTMPSRRLRESHAPLVQATARQLTDKLGGSYPPPAGIRGNPR